MVSFPAWYFDESNMAGVDFEDAAQVEAYDRNQTASTLDKEQALVARLGIAAEHSVIDLGAGTGNFALQASLTGASVHAVDILNQWAVKEALQSSVSAAVYSLTIK